jgi:class 3 adenylate cyclase
MPESAVCVTRDGSTRLGQTALVSMPETMYAKTRGGRIGYQVVGSGPPDVLVTKPTYLPVDLMWGEPRFVRFLNGLSSFSRHVWFDPRGMGSSDSIAPVEDRLIETTVDDMVSVLDELGCDRVVVLGAMGPPALQFAATHPERTSGLVLINPIARLRRADDYPEALSDEDVEAFLATVRDRWGTGETLSLLAPSMVGDAGFARWFGQCERLSMSPQDAYWRRRAGYEVDVRHLLAAIRVPTLVLVRAGWAGYEQGRYVAEHIDGARYVELDGDHLFFVGDTGPLLDAIEAFVTGWHPRREVDRVLATVMFTDVVGSTQQAAGMGDRRWSELLATHESLTRTELERFRGREIKTTGDGFLAIFDGPGRAVRCACAIRDTVRAIGIHVRGGLHTGEIELRGDDIGGIAVHIAQRVQALAQPDEVLVSRTITDLVGGSGIPFAHRGAHALKGVPYEWQLFAVEDPRLGSDATGELG